MAATENSLDDDFRIGRNFQIHRLALNHWHRLAAQPAGHGKLVRAIGKFADRCEHDGRINADGDGHRHVFFRRFVLADMFRRVLRCPDVQTKLAPTFQLQSVSADVAPAGFDIFRDDDRSGDIRTGILAWRPDYLR